MEEMDKILQRDLDRLVEDSAKLSIIPIEEDNEEEFDDFSEESSLF